MASNLWNPLPYPTDSQQSAAPGYFYSIGRPRSGLFFFFFPPPAIFSFSFFTRGRGDQERDISLLGNIKMALCLYALSIEFCFILCVCVFNFFAFMSGVSPPHLPSFPSLNPPLSPGEASLHLRWFFHLHLLHPDYLGRGRNNRWGCRSTSLESLCFPGRRAG